MTVIPCVPSDGVAWITRIVPEVGDILARWGRHYRVTSTDELWASHYALTVRPVEPGTRPGTFRLTPHTLGDQIIVRHHPLLFVMG